MFLTVSATVANMDMTERERHALAGYVRERRRSQFGTKSAAYRAARINSATWDRIEAGQPVREDRLLSAIKTLWPDGDGDWRTVIEPSIKFTGPVFSGEYEDPNYMRNIEEWVMELQDRIESLESAVFKEGDTDEEAPEPQQGTGGASGGSESGPPTIEGSDRSVEWAPEIPESPTRARTDDSGRRPGIA